MKTGAKGQLSGPMWDGLKLSHKDTDCAHFNFSNCEIPAQTTSRTGNRGQCLVTMRFILLTRGRTQKGRDYFGHCVAAIALAGKHRRQVPM